MISKMQKKEEAKPAAPTADVALLTEIRDALVQKPAPTKMPVAKKTPAKKTVAVKTVAKKAPIKKTPAKKTTARKTVAKK
jgi:hypothetical protein